MVKITDHEVIVLLADLIKVSQSVNRKVDTATLNQVNTWKRQLHKIKKNELMGLLSKEVYRKFELINLIEYHEFFVLKDINVNWYEDIQ